jgi:hypothetical protein
MAKQPVAIVNARALEAPRRRPFNEGMGEGRYVAIRGID